MSEREFARLDPRTLDLDAIDAALVREVQEEAEEPKRRDRFAKAYPVRRGRRSPYYRGLR